MQKRKGMFIAIEGIPGSGKSSRALDVVSYLSGQKETKDKPILLIKEPQRRDMKAKDKLRLIQSLVKPVIDEKGIAITTWYAHSDIAQQRAIRSVPIEQLMKERSGLVSPDLTIFVNTPPQEALKRKYGDSTQWSGQKILYLERMRAAYIEQAEALKKMGERIIVVDGCNARGLTFGPVKIEVDLLLDRFNIRLRKGEKLIKNGRVNVALSR